MSHEITLEEVAGKIEQVYVIMRMIESSHEELEDWEIKRVANLCTKLSGDVVCWMGEKIKQEEENHVA